MTAVIHEVFDKIIDSNNFTVGGGAGSAGAMSAGLVSMVCRLSTGTDLGLEDKKYVTLSTELDQIAEKLKQGAYDDEVAFLKI